MAEEMERIINEDAVLEDDYAYLKVLTPGGLNEQGAVCILEFGQHDGDEAACFWPVSAEGVRTLIRHLLLTLPREDIAGLVDDDRKGMN